ncbi:MAG: GTP-binding protein [Candidatus Lokiarchaeota archaeon]|nr:GTP-binding protein [Candidatus Lokiarchaeota archaeon]
MIDTYTQEKEILYTFKTVIVGPPSAGKTCLFNRFCFNSFNFDTSLTIGVNFHSIDLKIRSKDEINSLKETYNVQSIFDFGGQERFKALIPKFLGGANGVLLVFDLTSKNSFEQLEFWYNQVLEHANGLNLPKLLIGSKSDLISSTIIENLVTEEEIRDFILEKNMDGFFKTSALQNQNVLTVFKELNNLMLKHQNTQYVVS